MNKELDKKTAADVVLLLATFRCFEEQLYNLKGKHGQILKLYFNRLIGVARTYDKYVAKHLSKLNQNHQDVIQDNLMELIYTTKKIIDDENNNE
jgi:hypothetical protein|tara:strand:+ start:530 stop:811 length:282 start_codon:yes stop_codon:yes gene_type:complete